MGAFTAGTVVVGGVVVVVVVVVVGTPEFPAASYLMMKLNESDEPARVYVPAYDVFDKLREDAIDRPTA